MEIENNIAKMIDQFKKDIEEKLEIYKKQLDSNINHFNGEIININTKFSIISSNFEKELTENNTELRNSIFQKFNESYKQLNDKINIIESSLNNKLDARFSSIKLELNTFKNMINQKVDSQSNFEDTISKMKNKIFELNSIVSTINKEKSELKDRLDKIEILLSEIL